MLRAFLAPVVALGLMAATALGADETYTLKLYKSKKGDKTEHEKSETSKTSVNFTAGGMTKAEEFTGASKETFAEEILEKKAGDKRATKLTRTYGAAEKTAKGETTKPVYAGKTVLIEKKGDKFEFSIDGTALKEDEVKELANKFNKKDDEPQNQDFLPTEPVKVGGSWKVPADMSEKIFKTLGEEKMKADVKKSKIEGKLLKAYKKDGAQFGVLELTITVFITEIDLNGQFFKTSADSKMVLKATIDTCIDGTVAFEDVKMEVLLDLAAELPGAGSLAIKTTSTGSEKSRPAKK
jgi:hypothetical protein